MSRARRAVSGAVLSILQFGTQAALQAILYPLLLRAAGAPTLGAWSMLQQVLGYLALSDLGLGTALARALAQAAAHGSADRRFVDLLRAGRGLQIAGGAVYAALTLAFVPLTSWSRLQLPAASQADARHALVLLAVWSLVRAPFALAPVSLQATQRLASAGALQLASAVLRLVLSVLLTLHGFGLIGLVVSSIVAEAAMLVGAAFLQARVLRIPPLGARIPDRTLVAELLSFGARALAMGIAVKLIFATDSVVVGSLFGAASAGLYYTSQIPALFATTALWAIQDNAAPGINELIARGDEGNLARAYRDLLQLTFALAVPFAVGVLLFNRGLVRIWMGPSFDAGALLTASLAPFAALAVVHHLNSVVLHALGELRVLTRLVVLEGVMNLALSLVLGRALGLGGVMLASTIATVPTVVWAAVHLARRFQVQARTAIGPGALAASSGAGCSALALALPDSRLRWAGGVALFLTGGAGALALALGPALRLRLRRRR